MLSGRPERRDGKVEWAANDGLKVYGPNLSWADEMDQ